MIMKYFKSGLLLSMALVSFSLMTSCADDLEVGKKIDESQYNKVLQNNAYLRDGKSNLSAPIVELYENSYTTSVKLNLTKPATTATSAKVAIDVSYLETYNQEHGTDFQLYPQELVSFDNGGIINFTEEKSGEVGMTITGGESVLEDQTYAIPVAITEPSSDFTVQNETAKHCMYLVKDMRNASDAYKGEDVVKGFLFFEVNGTNPLNAFSFELENGKLLWDVVVLFAANINYDSDAGRPFVKCNPQVQYLLDNNETYLQPLRKRGIKVLLGLLGNHDMAGLAQLSEQGAKDFAREIAQYCYAYNLDGVNYDDEYSKNPDLDNPAFDSPSTRAAARLCYETKRAMPDKLVTVFDYGRMYGTSSVDGVDADEWIDVVVPNYGGSASPIGNMTYKKCAGSAAELNLGGGTSLSSSTAQRLISGGYGWHMGFAPSPAKYGSIFNRYSGASTLYGSDLKDPTIFYKHQDPKPYKYPDDLYN